MCWTDTVLPVNSGLYIILSNLNTVHYTTWWSRFNVYVPGSTLLLSKWAFSCIFCHAIPNDHLDHFLVRQNLFTRNNTVDTTHHHLLFHVSLQMTFKSIFWEDRPRQFKSNLLCILSRIDVSTSQTQFNEDASEDVAINKIIKFQQQTLILWRCEQYSFNL